jgi:hypothetical protein
MDSALGDVSLVCAGNEVAPLHFKFQAHSHSASDPFLDQ